MDTGIYLIFMVTTVMLILVPGPAAITVAAQGATQNYNSALFGVLGVASADVIFFALSATGIASLILASSLIFSVFKFAGVVYLMYLGFTALFRKSGMMKIDGYSKKKSVSGLFYQGLIVQLANPKALLYFSALLPQFVDPGEPVLFQLLIMGETCLIADLLVYSIYSHLGNRLAKRPLKTWVINLVNRVAGITLIFTGLKMASLEYTK